VRGETLRIGDHASDTLRQYLSIPDRFIQRLDADTTVRLIRDLWAKQQASRPSEEFSLSVKDGQLIGVAKAGLACVSNGQVADVLQSCFVSHGLDAAEVRHLRVDDHGAFSFGLTFPVIATEPCVGDIVQAGLNVVHSPVGNEATQVSVLLHRLVCENGAHAPICLGKKAIRIRRNRNGTDATELLERLRFVLDAGMNQLQTKLEELNRLAATKADVSPEHEIRNIATRRRLNRRIVDALLRALGEDESRPGGDSRYDVLLALSRVATHLDLDRRQSAELLRFSGVYSQGEHVRRCPYCRSFLVGSQSAELPN
jgi:hypothetical protein